MAYNNQTTDPAPTQEDIDALVEEEDEKYMNYLLEKERVCGLDKEERMELQRLLHR